MAKDELVRKFVLQGYGTKRARYWIREFINLGLLFEDHGIIDVEPNARERYRS